jgi:hypothetical protein
MARQLRIPDGREACPSNGQPGFSGRIETWNKTSHLGTEAEAIFLFLSQYCHSGEDNFIRSEKPFSKEHGP